MWVIRLSASCVHSIVSGQICGALAIIHIVFIDKLNASLIDASSIEMTVVSGQLYSVLAVVIHVAIDNFIKLCILS